MRVKMLILVNYLICDDEEYAMLFLKQPRYQFKGVVIQKKELPTRHT